MDALEIRRLEESRQGWIVLSSILLILVAAALISSVAYHIGQASVKEQIVKSGYAMTEVLTKTNTYVIIEKVD